MHKNNKTLKFITKTQELLGYINHKIRARNNPITGENKNGTMLEILGTLISLLNNLRASANG